MGKINKNRDVGFWISFQKLTFTRLYFSTIFSSKTYKSWDEFKFGIFIFLLPIALLFVIWSFTGFTLNEVKLTNTLQDILIAYGLIVIPRFFLHKEFGMLSDGESIFYVGVIIFAIAFFIYAVVVAINEYDYPFLLAIIPAIISTTLFTYLLYLFGGGLIMGDIDD